MKIHPDDAKLDDFSTEEKINRSVSVYGVKMVGKLIGSDQFIENFSEKKLVQLN